MAGRIAIMLAEGIPPRAIAAVTFTELAASELLARVREFVADLSAGHIAPELRVALPDGLSPAQRDSLAAASAAIDEITCSTIHGFCQRLIKPYPAEADIDPGATVMDRNQADLTFLEIVDVWLRERLSGDQGGILAEMVLHSPSDTVALIRKIAESAPPPHPQGAPGLSARRSSTSGGRRRGFHGLHARPRQSNRETAVIVERLGNMATALAAGPDPATPSGWFGFWSRVPSRLAPRRAPRLYRKKGKWTAAAKQAGLPSRWRRLNIAAEPTRLRRLGPRFFRRGPAWLWRR